MTSGEAKRLEPGSEWEHTIEDLCDLMANSKAALGRDDLKTYATRAVTFVLGNLERRGIIDDAYNPSAPQGDKENIL